MQALDERQCVELGRLRNRNQQRAFLHASQVVLSMDVVRQITEAVRSAVRVDVRKALDFAHAALAVARELKSMEALGLGLRAKANALWFMGDCRPAVRYFERAAWLFEKVGSRGEVARTLSSSIQSLALLGEYNRASAAAEKARAIFTDLGEPWRVARLDINLANVFHRQNRYAEAFSVYERAYRDLLPHRDTEGLGVAMHNMAVCLIALDDFKRALETYERVREFCAKEEMVLLVAQADYNAAHLYYLRGDYTKALELLRSTRETYCKNGDHYHLSLCDLDQSEIYLELGLVDEAVEMAQASLEQFEQQGMKFEAARSMINLAIAVSLQRDASRALTLFARAREITRGENNQVWPNLIDLYRALVLVEENRLEEAQNLGETVADFFSLAGMPTKQVICLLLITRISLRTGNLKQASERCEQAQRILERVDTPMLFYEAHFLQGQIHEASGEPQLAYAAYQQARSALEVLRSSLQRQELKIGLMRNRLAVYSRLIQLCLNQGGDGASAEALSYVEAAKSRTLRDLILEGARPGGGLSQEAEIDPRLRELRKELNWYYHRLERESLTPAGITTEGAASLQKEASSREHQLSRLLLEMPTSVGVGAALRNSSTASLHQIRDSLGPEAALLEYFAIEEATFVAVVTATNLKIIPLGPLDAIAQRLRMVQFQLSKFRLNADYLARFRNLLLAALQSHLQALYDALIAPVLALLPVRDLVIVPFGPLHSLPFHALFDGEKYLIERFGICYEPSASIFAHSHRSASTPSGSSLIIGIDDPKLPFIREEVDAVAALVANPRVLFGTAATEAGLRRYGSSSQLVHIATHGIFRQDSPMFSSIRLADSYLTLYDLYHMDLPVDLLTLSGCVTGLNVVADGDELLGLTRGLLYAGARSLLLSLWDVDDRSTSEFMKEFYRQLQGRSRKADALQSAMLHQLQRYPHPYYWAPFKLIGRALA